MLAQATVLLAAMSTPSTCSQRLTGLLLQLLVLFRHLILLLGLLLFLLLLHPRGLQPTGAVVESRGERQAEEAAVAAGVCGRAGLRAATRGWHRLKQVRSWLATPGPQGLWGRANSPAHLPTAAAPDSPPPPPPLPPPAVAIRRGCAHLHLQTALQHELPANRHGGGREPRKRTQPPRPAACWLSRRAKTTVGGFRR